LISSEAAVMIFGLEIFQKVVPAFVKYLIASKPGKKINVFLTTDVRAEPSVGLIDMLPPVQNIMQYGTVLGN
jgi:hypothetical protein